MNDYSLFSPVYVLLIIVLILLTTCICLDVIVKRRFLLKYAKNSPVLPYLPIIGNAHLLVGPAPMLTYLDWGKKMKIPFFFWMFNVPYYSTNEPSEIKEVLMNPNALEKGDVYDLMKPVLFDSLITAEVSIWKKKRRFLSRRFTQKALENMVPVFNKMISKLIATIDQNCSGNFLEMIERFGVDTFVETLCNIPLDEMSIDTTAYKKFDMYNCIKSLSRSVFKRYTKPWLYPDIIFFNTTEGKEFQRIHQSLNGLLHDVIEERRNFTDNKGEDVDNSIIDLMIQENMNNDDIIAELKLFGGASADTSGLTVSLALNLLAMHPDIQEKVLREVLDVVGPDKPVEYKDILNLKFTEMVIQETLRLFPPAPILCRIATADVDIGRISLPKGTNMTVNIMGVHRSEKYWTDPLKFDPYRFLPEEVEKRPPGTFLPFSLRPRNCIGGAYAMILMKATLATIIRNYKITTEKRSVEDFKLNIWAVLVVEDIDFTFIRRQED